MGKKIASLILVLGTLAIGVYFVAGVKASVEGKAPVSIGGQASQLSQLE